MSLDEADRLFASVRPLVEGIAATFGETCEVVLHDYRTPEQSVIAVTGTVTGRAVGSVMSEIGMRMFARGSEASNEINYLTRTPDGRTVKSSTLPLKTSDGTLVGALCINVDVTALSNARRVLDSLLAADVPDTPRKTVFANDLDEVVDALVREQEMSLGQPAAAAARADRRAIVAALWDRGVFEVRGAADRVAPRLGVSRAALYADLAAVRKKEENP